LVRPAPTAKRQSYIDSNQVDRSSTLCRLATFPICVAQARFQPQEPLAYALLRLEGMNRKNTGREYHATCAGFSFLEVLTVIAVGAALYTMAVPRLAVFRAQFQLTSAARQVAVNIQRARMKAVGENGYTRVVFNDDGSYVLQSSRDGTTFTNAEAPQHLPSGITFLGTLPQLTFNRLGALDGAATITIGNSQSQTKVVQANVLGEIGVT
jgi:Tfp pilus assembly protein FimT